MPLQNRVTPFGDIIEASARGTILGNRGILHNDRRELVRVTHLRRWICCVLQYKGIRRTLMKPRSWTELFFLDEATAFAAGHRPCFECRRAAARDFQNRWSRALGTPALPKADEMDRVLSVEREKTHQAELRDLPSGAFIAIDHVPYLVHANRLLCWTVAGYTHARARESGEVLVLTPPATVSVLRAGYVPQLHPSAEAASGT